MQCGVRLKLKGEHMKITIKAFGIIAALVATAAHADKASAIKCVKDHFEKRAYEDVPSDAGYRNIELIAGIYDLSNVYNGIEKFEDDAEAQRKIARDLVKERYGRYGWAGEINYCFRQHMGG